MAHQTHHPKKATAVKQRTVEKVIGKVSAAKQQEEQESSAPEERHLMIAEAAYRLAEQRGFQGDMALNDWLQAEAEVDARFAEKH